MKLADQWRDYRVIATGNGEKLEQWGDVTLLRPDPQVIWRPPFRLSEYRGLNARYSRESTGGGRWEVLTELPQEWKIRYGACTFCLKPMGFKHTGLFPEQAVNWDMMCGFIREANRPIKVLNLFGYTGGASVMCAQAGASVTHVDASKGMCERAGLNARASGVDGIRYIVDDCAKFVSREIRRGNRYDAILMDPPSYGRGPGGEMWKIEDNISDFMALTAQVLSDRPLFVLINSYTTGLQPSVMANLLKLNFPKGEVEAYEVGLPTDVNGIVLPCGCSAVVRYTKN